MTAAEAWPDPMLPKTATETTMDAQPAEGPVEE